MYINPHTTLILASEGRYIHNPAHQSKARCAGVLHEGGCWLRLRSANASIPELPERSRRVEGPGRWSTP